MIALYCVSFLVLTILFCILFSNFLPIIHRTGNDYNYWASAEGTPPTNGTSNISIKTDSARYATGHDVTISGNITNATGHNIDGVANIQIFREGDKGPQIYTSVFARDGLFYYKVPNLGPAGKYNVSAQLNKFPEVRWTSFEVSDPTFPTFPIVLGAISIIVFIFTLFLPKISSDNTYYIPGVLRFLSLSGIALTPAAFFIYADLEFGINSPMGLVTKESAINGSSAQWVINIGGSNNDNYSAGLQIPFYVFALGIAGGYLRYLYRAAFGSEDKPKGLDSWVAPDPNKKRDEFMVGTLGELSEIILAPFVAVAAWFLLSIAGRPEIYTIALVSFTVGLTTKDIVNGLVKFTRGSLKISNTNHK